MIWLSPSMERKRAQSAETCHDQRPALEASKQDECVLPLKRRRRQAAACNPSIGSLWFRIYSALAFTSSAASPQAVIPPPTACWTQWVGLVGRSDGQLRSITPFPCAWKPLLKHAVVPKSMDFGTRCTWACTLFFWDEFFLP